MKSIISLLSIFFWLQSATSQTPVPYLKKNGKYIYVDSATMQPSAKFNGEMQEAFMFDKGVAFVKTDKAIVYFNENGIILNTCITKNCNSYYDGFTFLLKESGNTYCLSNKEGKALTPYKYREFWGYSEGMFIAKNDFGNYVYVDTTGSELTGIVGDDGWSFKEVLPFKNGFARVISRRTRDNELFKQVFIDKKAQRPKEFGYYLFLNDFSEGLAAVTYSGSKWGYIDETGKEVISQKYSKPGAFNQGYAVVYAMGSKTKGIVIDKGGKEICDFPYYIESDYYYGIVGVSFKGKEKFEKGFINMKGKLIGKKTFDHFVLPGNGLIAAGYRKPNNPQAYSLQIYNTSLETVSINKLYDDVGVAGSNGMIKVGYEKKYGYINSEGKEVIALKYDEAKDFQNGYASVKASGSNWFYIDATGREYREQ